MNYRAADAKDRRVRFPYLLAALPLLGFSVGAFAVDLSLVEQLEQPQAGHVDQATLVEISKKDPHAAFETAFVLGDELFETAFNALDGVGADVGNGQRFTRVPRADLAAWLSHTPPRATGPNGEACNHCHSTPPTGAGPAALDVHRDPLRNGLLNEMIRRNTPHLMGMGALQRAAEEMTDELHEIRNKAAQRACRSGRPQTKVLKTNIEDQRHFFRRYHGHPRGV